MTDEESVVGVDVGTDLTAATAADIRSVVVDAMQLGRLIELYVQSVISYDAAGLGLLLGLHRRIEAADGHLVCVNPSAPLFSGIRRLGLHRILEHPGRPATAQKSGTRAAHAGDTQDSGRRSPVVRPSHGTELRRILTDRPAWPRGRRSRVRARRCV